MRVLLVEDHVELAETVATGLRREGMAVDVALDGNDALAHLALTDYDVLVLDRDLPGVHGDQICRSMVAERRDGRILMLTASGSIEDRVDGLGLGADDYLPKPFAFAELVARVRALGRRAGAASPPALVHGDLRVDPAHRLAIRGGQRLALSPKEFAVLEYLLGAAGRIVSAEELLERVWDENADPFTSTTAEGHHPAAACRAGRAAADRDGDPRRLPDLNTAVAFLTRRRPRLPRYTIRLRLAVLYSGVFLVLGILLLAILILSVRQSTHGIVVSAEGAAAKLVEPHVHVHVTTGGSTVTTTPEAVGLEHARARAHQLEAVAVNVNNSDLHHLLIWSIFALAIMAVASIGVGWLLAGRVLRPLRGDHSRRT